MKQIILQLTAIIVYKFLKVETSTMKEMKENYRKEKAEWQKKAAELQKELDAEHLTRFGWDPISVARNAKA